jgi:peptidoglycan hydrolase CwlO-like protein
LVIIDSIRISNTQNALRKGLESFLTLAKDCEKMAEILEDHKEAIQDHC